MWAEESLRQFTQMALVDVDDLGDSNNGDNNSDDDEKAEKLRIITAARARIQKIIGRSVAYRGRRAGLHDLHVQAAFAHRNHF
ncbi:hypothetical protein GCM10009528_07010 [Kineococcus aurantiacus]